MEYGNRIEKENISRAIEENIQCLNEIFEQMEIFQFLQVLDYLLRQAMSIGKDY